MPTGQVISVAHSGGEWKVLSEEWLSIVYDFVPIYVSPKAASFAQTQLLHQTQE